MKNVSKNKPSHVVRGNILDELGFSHAEASALKVKAELLSAILKTIRDRGYTQSEVCAVLHEHQPSVSNLLRGKISSVSTDKLLRYADRLCLKTCLTVGEVSQKETRHSGVVREMAGVSM